MRGPQIEEPVVEIKEEEKSGPLRIIPALPPPEDSSLLPSDGSRDMKKEDSQPP